MVPQLAACGAGRPAQPQSSASAPTPAPRTSYAVSKDGVELAIEEAGPRDAPAIVFIHGLGFTRDIWRRQLEGPLAQRYHLIAFDHRGHGRSTRPTDEAAYSDGTRWADDLHAVLTATNAKQPILVGWSLGGLVISHYLRVHGDSAIAGAVFVAAVTKIVPELLMPNVGEYLVRLGDQRDDVRRAATLDFMRACFATQPPDDELKAIQLAAGVLSAPTHNGIARMSVEGLEPALRGLSKPSLVIHGVQDALVAEAMATYIRSLVPAAQLSLFENSGHTPFMEETARFNVELERFAAATGAPSPQP